MSDIPRRSSFPWRTLLVVLLTAGLLWWFFRNVDFGNVWAAIQGAHVWMLLLAVGVTFQTYVVRTWRWQALLVPIGHAKFEPAFRTTVIGFTATFLLPGRLGEVLRPYLLAREAGFNAAATFATIIIERVLDLAAVVLLFAFFLLTTPAAVSRELRLGGGLAAAVALVALAAMTVSAGHPDRFERWAGAVLRILPVRLAAVATRLVRHFIEGLAVMRRPGPLVVSFALSIVLWMSIGLGVWLCSRAFDLTFAFSGSFLVLMFLVVGVAVPVPAGVGSFHEMYRYAVVTFFAADNDRAIAAALVLHAVSFLPISILGLALMARQGLTFVGLQRMKSTAEAAEGKGLSS